MKHFLSVTVFLAFVSQPFWATSSETEHGGPGELTEKSDDATSIWQRPLSEGGPVYKVNPLVDIPVLTLSGMTVIAWFLGDEIPKSHCAPLCNSNDVNSFDRWLAGNYNERWATATDITVAATLTLGGLSVLADAGFASGLIDIVVIGEAVLLANGFIVALNMSVRRPRPYLYSEKAPVEVRNNGSATLSFPSGHVGVISAATASVFGALYTRSPSSPWPWIFLGVGTAASCMTAVGRVMAGRHFTSDALIGAAIGVSMGVLVPALHKKNVIVTPKVTSHGGLGMAFTGSF